MARPEHHTSHMPAVDQRTPLRDNATTYAGDVVTGETVRSVDATYLADLAMNEEPVTIRIEPSADKNAANSHPVWVNGKGAEVLINGRWVEMIYLPTGVEMIVKRKYVGVIVGAKTDTVHTRVREMESERPNNVIERFTSPVCSLSIIQDDNRNGAAWVQAIRRRQL